MRIGIITQPLRYNYGGILQNYALQTVLKSKGYTVVTLDGDVKVKRTFKSCLFKKVKYILRLLSDKNGRFLHIWKLTFTDDLLSQNTSRFIKQYIDVQKLRHLRECSFAALIVGSDQVWRPLYSNLDDAYLRFARKWNNIKRVAYAASFGSDDWEYNEEETKQCKALISLFDAVSVREDSGVILCRKYLNVEAVHVLDPTMLLTKDDYLANLNILAEAPSEGDLFYYFLDSSPGKNNLVQLFAREYGWAPFTVNSNVENISAPIKERIQPPIEKWLRGFYDAKFIITDSFHGCVFSIIFNKPFVVVVNNKRGRARFDSLLNLFGQNSRMIDSSSNYDFDKSIMNCPNIDIGSQRVLSLSFLERALGIL